MFVTLRFSRALALALGLSAAALVAQNSTPPYLDPTRPQAERVDDLISRLTLEEKVSMMSNTTPGIPRLGIPKYNWWSEALHGVANAGHATVFPQAIGLAAMWNESLQHEIAQTIGVEGRAKFNGYKGTPDEGLIFRGLTFWSPNVNIFRDPRWGRGQETYGEDPFLTSRLGVAFVRGLQGDHPDYLVAAACAKHFAVHSGPEPLRHIFDATPTPADLHETYLPAFEALVREARVEIVMTAYNALNGVPCSVHPFLYQSLRDWGFDGHVTSDCGSVSDLSRTYKWAPDDAAAEALTVRAGMNVRCGFEPPSLVDAVQRGLVSEQEVDQRLHDLLRTLFRLGIFDPADRVPFNKIAPTENDTPAHGALALRAARESLVLLKNDGLLPLNPQALRRVAVIGPNATSTAVLVGNYNGEPSAPVTLLAGLKAALEPAGVTVDYAHGCDYATRPDSWRLIPQPWFQGEYFANRELQGEPVARDYDRPLCISCRAAKPAKTLPAGVPEKDVSVRWKGDLQTTLAGEYRFRVRGRGGFRLLLDGKVIIDAWAPATGEPAAERVAIGAAVLPENSNLPIRLEYVQGDGPLQVALEWITPAADAPESEALELAQQADVIVYAGGISAQLEGEEMEVDYDGFVGGDRLRIELPELQQRLLEKLRATGKPLVFVNFSGSAVAMPWADQNLNAIVQAWYPGQAGGTAIADVLLGAYNPAGRLPLTFYCATEDLPDFNDYAMTGRTYRYFAGEPLYAFGHGLSYTRFEYLGVRADRLADGGVEVAVELRNTGKRDGDEVVQLYAVPPAGVRPDERQSLCGFQRVHLAAGETQVVKIVVPETALRRWDEAEQKSVVPDGEWLLHVGASSADIRLATAFVVGDAAALRARAGSNPLFRDAFTADPAPLVVGDTLYLYVGHDEATGKQMFNITEWLCYSTKDLRQWTAHGSVLKPTDFSWATGEAWASQVVEKDGKFYFYTTVQHGEPHVGKSIGVAVGDSPLGPFTDARGTALVRDDTTPSDKPWNDIDPTVFIDDDGSAYLAWGNPYLYFAKLKPSMTEIDGEIRRIELPYYTEGPWLHKQGDLYYLTYAAFAHQGKWEKICYATASSIDGPWTYRGILTDQTRHSYTIHPGIVEFQGRSYLFYHTADLTLNGETGGLGRRSVTVEPLEYNTDGTMKPVAQTVSGVSLVPLRR